MCEGLSYGKPHSFAVNATQHIACSLLVTPISPVAPIPRRSGQSLLGFFHNRRSKRSFFAGFPQPGISTTTSEMLTCSVQ